MLIRSCAYSTIHTSDRLVLNPVWFISNMRNFLILLVSSLTNALSFYMSQNIFDWSKFFVLDQKFIYILWQSQSFFAKHKDGLHSVKLVFVTKVFEEALNAVKFLAWHKTFWDL